MPLARSQLDRLTDPHTFHWATGIEDTFITDPWPATGRILDEYELVGHYERWREDLDRMAELGIRTARYGIPWHRVQPAPGVWDWSFPDRALSYLLELGIEPIVDLVHYGLPAWIEGAFLHPDYPERVAEFAARLAERFRGRIRAYTPLNEPRITAWYCGKLGWWPPYRRGWRGFAEVLVALCRGIVRTGEALLAVDPEILLVHVDATDLYSSPDPTLEEEVRLRQRIGFLALDLVSGRVTEAHPLREWLLRHGIAAAAVEWFQEHRSSLDVVGLNMYPMFSRKRLVRSPRGLRIQMPYGSGELVEQLCALYWERYRRPLMITETAARGPRRRSWLRESTAAVRRLRERGIPVVGYTWWPMLAMVAWAYRQSNRPATEYLESFGLWDLDPDPAARLRRVPTPLVDAYRKLVAGGVAAVGVLGAGSGPEARAA